MNKLTVFFATGLWHGANWTFVVWGLWHGMFLLLEEVVPVQKLPRALRHVYALLVVCVGFVLFRADTISQGIGMIGKMFLGWSFQETQMNLVLAQMTPLFLLTLCLAVVGSLPWLPELKRLAGKKNPAFRRMDVLGYVCSPILLLLCMMSLSGGTYNPFIYFRF